MLLVPLCYQEVRHAGVLQAGLLVVPQALGSAVAMVLGPRLGRRFSPRALMLGGVALSPLGTIAFTQLASGPAGWVLALSLPLRGLGIGATMSPGMTAVFASVTREQAPRASSALNVLNRIGVRSAPRFSWWCSATAWPTTVDRSPRPTAGRSGGRWACRPSA
jgi:MFS family permease